MKAKKPVERSVPPSSVSPGGLARILIIDDSPSDRRIYRRFLEGRPGTPAEFEILDAATGKAGLEGCRAGGVDCIILDFKLPDGTGLDLIKDLRESCPAPIVFVTGEPLPLTQTQAYGLGVVKYLSKDFLSSDSLRAAVGEALGKV